MPVPGAFTLADRPVGGDAPPLVIGEVAQAHDGSLGHRARVHRRDRRRRRRRRQVPDAHRRAPRARRPSRCASRSPGRTRRRYDYWKRMEFTEDQWRGLAAHAARARAAVPQLAVLARGGRAARAGRRPGLEDRLGRGRERPPARRESQRTGLPVLLSSGHELLRGDRRARSACSAAERPFAVLQCTSAYPCPPEQIGLNLLAELARALRLRRSGCPTTPARSIRLARGGDARRVGRRGARHARAARCSAPTCPRR